MFSASRTGACVHVSRRERKSKLARYSVASGANMNAAPVWEAAVAVLAKNRVLTLMFRDKLNC